MLTNWQAKDIISVGQSESIANDESDEGLGSIWMTAHIAVLGETMVFFTSVNSCQF